MTDAVNRGISIRYEWEGESGEMDYEFVSGAFFVPRIGDAVYISGHYSARRVTDVRWLPFLGQVYVVLGALEYRPGEEE